MKFESYIFILFFLFLISCKKETASDEADAPQVVSQDSIVALSSSTLVTTLNGFSFEAAFINTEPQAYPYLWLQYIDDYLDSTRIVVNNQNAAQSITVYLCSNHANGVATRSFDHTTFPNDRSNTIHFAFNHPQFLLQWYERTDGPIVTVGNLFGINTSTANTFTGMLPQYQFEFLDRYLIRYISGISLYPFHYQNWSDEQPFVVTEELSEPIAWDHWFDETWSTWPYDVKSNMYTGFVNNSNNITYVGIAKGNQNLDTIHINNLTYAQFSATSSQIFLDKSGDILFLGLVNDIPGTSSREVSMYKYEIATAQMIPLFEKQPLSGSFIPNKLIKGRFWGSPIGSSIMVMDRTGATSTINGPASAFAYGFKFGRNKLYFIALDGNIPRLEVYSIQI